MVQFQLQQQQAIPHREQSPTQSHQQHSSINSQLQQRQQHQNRHQQSSSSLIQQQKQNQLFSNDHHRLASLHGLSHTGQQGRDDLDSVLDSHFMDQASATLRLGSQDQQRQFFSGGAEDLSSQHTPQQQTNAHLFPGLGTHFGAFEDFPPHLLGGEQNQLGSSAGGDRHNTPSTNIPRCNSASGRSGSNSGGASSGGGAGGFKEALRWN
jgi:hypothetical protein